MAIIKYQVKENTTLGTHSFYAQAVSYSTLDIDDLAEEIAEGLGISPVLVRAVVERYAVVAERNVLRGHRVKLSDLLTFYPQVSASVKDVVDEKGEVITRATADMLSVQNGKSAIGVTVSQAVQQKFAASVSWKKMSYNTDSDTDGSTTTSPDSSAKGSGTSSDDSASSGSGSSTSSSASGGSLTDDNG